MNEIILVNNTLTRSSEQTLVSLIQSLKELEQREKELKEELKEEMVKRGIVKIDTDKITIAYRSPTTKETFDTKKFREEHRDLYDEYVKLSVVKDYVKWDVK